MKKIITLFSLLIICLAGFSQTENVKNINVSDEEIMNKTPKIKAEGAETKVTASETVFESTPESSSESATLNPVNTGSTAVEEQGKVKYVKEVNNVKVIYIPTEVIQPVIINHATITKQQ